ncbi:MAG: ribonuclease D [Desulfobacterales bacterium]|nr:ribonuclease D [Desulfobacterales bacterium]
MPEERLKPIQLIHTPSEMAAAAGHLADQSIIAGDLEADSLFHFQERICLLQLAAPDTIYIIDPLALADMTPIKRIMEDRTIKKVFHGADYDVRSLYRDFRINFQNLFDTELASRFLGYSETGLNAIIKQAFHVELEKKFQRKDWSQRPLPDEMVEYAADDVRYLIDLQARLEAQLVEKGRLAWVMEECEDIAAVRPAPMETRPLFTRCKGAGRLPPRSLAVLEALLEMRHQKARQKDRPPFKVIGTTALIDLAQRRPKSMNALRSLNILSSKQIDMHGKDILQAIKTGNAVPADQLPAFPKHFRPKPSAESMKKIRDLKKWRQREADKLAVDPGVFFSNAQIKAVVEAVPSGIGDLEAINGLKKWQIREYGEKLIEMIRSPEG